MDRKQWIQVIITIAAVVASVIGARWGIQIPVPPIQFDVPPHPMPIAPPTQPQPKADAWNAIGKIQFGNSGCSATIIGPRRVDGRWWILTAAHCVSGTGQKGRMQLRDGRTTGISVVAVDRQSDCCWCITENNTEVYPFTALAKESPEPGSKIWHGGFGIDRPGNKEEGEVRSKAGPSGQISMHLSVSSGDSGGGICLNENGEVVSCVCCTTRLSGPGMVFGASPERIRQLQPQMTDAYDNFQWTPIPVPVVPEPKE